MTIELRLKDLNEPLLRDLYIDKEYSILSMSKILGHTCQAIKRWLVSYGIPLRTKSQSMMGKKNPVWKGGFTYNKYGYKQIRIPEHPRANEGGYIFEHIVVWEKANGKLLSTDYVVHHLNGIKDDNRAENLVALKRNEHAQILLEPYRERIRELEEEIKKLKANF